MPNDDDAGFAPGPIHRFLADDHRRLEGLLDRATADLARIDPLPYDEFRRGLLKHIGMEEKILLPVATKARGGEALEVAGKLRLDHGAIVSLLVPTPTRVIVGALRSILAGHDAIEEGADGLYHACERALGADVAGLVEKLRAAPEVPVHPHADGANVVEAARRALARAGFSGLLGD
jgi:hypothetical protein